jgi:hypothetical protein
LRGIAAFGEPARNSRWDIAWRVGDKDAGALKRRALGSVAS